MAVERTPSGSSLIDVLDRVLDKGIVIERVELIEKTGGKSGLYRKADS
jgi:molybdenum cofactor biosynthesis enzyme